MIIVWIVVAALLAVWSESITVANVMTENSRRDRILLGILSVVLMALALGVVVVIV